MEGEGGDRDYTQEPTSHFPRYYYGAPPPNYPPTAGMTYDQQALMNQNGQKVYVVQAGAPQGPPLAGRNVRIVDRPGFKDGWAAVLFLIFLAGFVAMAVIGVPNVINEIKGGNGINISSGDFQLDVKQVAQIIGYAALTGLGMSVV
ncbi:hypothetical protein HK405_011768, partial [Cladochytrium tenue]